MANIPKLCQECGQVYWSNFGNSFHLCIPKKDPPKLETCSQIKPPKKKIKPELKEHTCKDCGEKFQSTYKVKNFCNKKCEQHYDIKVSNEKWIKRDPNKKRKIPSYVINGILEGKRVYYSEAPFKKFKAVRG